VFIVVEGARGVQGVCATMLAIAADFGLGGKALEEKMSDDSEDDAPISAAYSLPKPSHTNVTRPARSSHLITAADSSDVVEPVPGLQVHPRPAPLSELSFSPHQWVAPSLVSARSGHVRSSVLSSPFASKFSLVLSSIKL
jgi:hypothetical protein